MAFFRLFTVVAVVSAVIQISTAFSIFGASTKSTAMFAEPSTSNRRAFFSTLSTLAPAAALATLSPSSAAAAASSKDALLSDLQESLKKLEPVPDLLQKSEWESVRKILKTPPVNQLWNLGDSQNILVRLAKETGEYELLEVKDEVSISLQMCDQYSYDNVFVYYQPGKV